MKIYSKILVALGLTVAFSACENDTEFKTGNKRKKTSKTQNSDNLGSEKSYNDLIGGEGVQAMTALATSATQNSVWVVTSDGVVTKILLDKEKGYPTKTWNGTSGGGHRTYVTKVGLIVGANGGKIYRVDDDIPEGTAAQHIIDAQGADGGSRICLTSYKIGDTEYIGGGYHGGGQRRFVSIPIDKTKPNKLDVSRVKYYMAGPGVWGYSCSTDQARKYFWSKDNATGGNVSGIDLKTGNPIGLDKVPNGGHVNNAGASLNLAGGAHSYSMSTDLLGNVLSFNNGYTAAHETLSDTIFVTLRSSNNVVVLKGDCVRNKSCGESDVAAFDMSGTTYARPMSSLNDGRVVGISRGSTSDVSLFSLKDPKDISKGLNVEVIKTVAGDAYMYADFTGATIYASTEVKPVDFSSASGFKPDAPVKQLYLKWVSESGMAEEWRGLVASIRCYLPGKEGEVSFEKISSMPQAGEPLKVAADSCNKKPYSMVEIKVEPDGSSIYSKTKSFEFVIEQ